MTAGGIGVAVLCALISVIAWRDRDRPPNRFEKWWERDMLTPRQRRLRSQIVSVAAAVFAVVIFVAALLS